ncbi:hypothetical protein [Endozoicomonas arenosclerae]|uniref:hypothetical protein n=1 Tax=Endozoicomonas arenosclerae TaxID=1633495 RepID=UPI000A6299AC|nr:hypothetical protein [Endozoicomonas arenosclerae]
MTPVVPSHEQEFFSGILIEKRRCGEKRQLCQLRSTAEFVIEVHECCMGKTAFGQ